MDDVNFSYPAIRLGKICSINSSIDLAMAKEISDHLKKSWDENACLFKKRYQEEMDKFNGQSISAEIIDLSKQELHEGPVSFAPKILSETKIKNGLSIVVVNGSSVVVCVGPNHSKIWTRTSLSSFADKGSEHLPAPDCIDFFDSYKRHGETIGNILFDEYKKILKECVAKRYDNVNGEDLIVEHNILIKTLGSTSPSVYNLLNPISRKETFSISDSFRDVLKVPALKAFLRFCFNKDFQDEEEYSSTIKERKRQWNELSEETRNCYPDILRLQGYNWFGLKSSVSNALFARIEDPENSLTAFTGIGLETKGDLYRYKDDRDPDTVSRIIGRDLIVSIAPFI